MKSFVQQDSVFAREYGARRRRNVDGQRPGLPLRLSRAKTPLRPPPPSPPRSPSPSSPTPSPPPPRAPPPWPPSPQPHGVELTPQVPAPLPAPAPAALLPPAQPRRRRRRRLKRRLLLRLRGGVIQPMACRSEGKTCFSTSRQLRTHCCVHVWEYEMRSPLFFEFVMRGAPSDIREKRGGGECNLYSTLRTLQGKKPSCFGHKKVAKNSCAEKRVCVCVRV